VQVLIDKRLKRDKEKDKGRICYN